jgi:MFS family permease
MEKKLIAPQKTRRRNASRLTGPIYAATIFFAFHYYFIIYINSSFLSQYMNSTYVSIMYVLGAALSLVLFFIIPQLLKKYGNYRIFVDLILLEMLAIIGLAWAPNFFLITLFFLLQAALPSLLFYSLDVFLEQATANEHTGRTRATYMTLINSVVVVSPFIVGSILAHGTFSLIYISSFLFLIPLLMIALYRFDQAPAFHYRDMHFTHSLPAFLRNKNVATVFLTDFFLQFFYCVMVIYMPLYLVRVIGFSWPEIGVIFTIMLLPFVILEIPLGSIADKYLGEKEILVIGFVIICLAVFLIPYLQTPTFIAWTLLLFVSRIGASFIEIANETYFFKQVSSDNADFISLYRTTIPLSYILGPLAGGLILIWSGYGALFTMLGIAMLVGLVISTRLIDTL